MASLNDYIDQLKDLDQNNIGSWPTWVYALFIIVLIAAVVAGSYYYVVTPSRQTLAEAQQHEQDLKERFRNKHERVAHLEQYKKQLKDLKNELKGMLAELPSKSEVPALLRDVSDLRAANGLTEELFKPLDNDKHKFYVTLPNRLVVRGGFHDLARFVSDVAQMSRIVTIGDVDIHPVDNKPGELKMSIRLQTYRYINNASS